MKIPHEIVKKSPWHHLKLTQEIATAEKEGGKVAPHQAALPGRFTMDRSAELWWISGDNGIWWFIVKWWIIVKWLIKILVNNGSCWWIMVNVGESLLNLDIVMENHGDTTNNIWIMDGYILKLLLDSLRTGTWPIYGWFVMIYGHLWWFMIFYADSWSFSHLAIENDGYPELS